MSPVNVVGCKEEIGDKDAHQGDISETGSGSEFNSFSSDQSPKSDEYFNTTTVPEGGEVTDVAKSTCDELDGTVMLEDAKADHVGVSEEGDATAMVKLDGAEAALFSTQTQDSSLHDAEVSFDNNLDFLFLMPEL